MKAGERITCPHCGEKTIVKLKPKMGGWTRVGDVLACAFCGAELGTPESGAKGAEKSASAVVASRENVVRDPRGSIAVI